VPGRGAGFSLEAPEGVRFLTRGRAFDEREIRLLADRRVLTGADCAGAGRTPGVER